MERKFKFKVGDKVKVIATKEQLIKIGIGENWDDELFNEDIFEKKLFVKEVEINGNLNYFLNNYFYFEEEYLDYAD